MHLRTILVLFGIGFLFLGIAGYMPLFTHGKYLFGLFFVSNAHNIIHIVSGISAFFIVYKHAYALRYFCTISIIYGLLALLGFWQGSATQHMHLNTADNILHLGIALIAFYAALRLRSFVLPSKNE